MKRLLQNETRLMLLALAFFIAGITYADDFKYTDSWGKQGFALTNQKSTSVEVNYSINTFALSKELINGISMDAIGLPGTFLPNNEGAPNLPGDGRYIAIPQGAKVQFQVTASRTEKFTNVDLAPAFKIPWANDDGPLVYNQDMSIYSKNEFYPANPVIVSEVTQVRGVDAVILGITPFQYNPVTKELIVYRDLKIEVTFEGGNGHFGEDRLRSRWWDPMLSDMLLNYESLPKMNYNKSFQSTDETGCEYLIISPNGAEFLQWADSIRVFRTLQGIKTDIVTLGEIGGNNAVTIENYINNAYNTWDIPPAAIMLFGDYGTNAANSVTSPIYDNYCVSDNIYADVNADQMPDIIAARMTAINATQLQTMVTKFIHYERTPPTDPDFYAHPMTCLGYQTERWFQICTESVAGFWEQELGKTTNRVNAIYNGNPQTGPWSTATNTSTVVNYFGPNGLGYIPATPGGVNCTWNGTGNNVVTGINNGAFILLHRDHGAETLWGEPDFSNSHVNSLNNTDLTYIWSVNCLTGKYNYSGECLVEKLHRHTSGGNTSGALGAIGDSEVSYSFVNDVYVWGAFDNMWPDFMPAYGTTPPSRGLMPGFANAAGKYFLQQSSWPYNTDNKEVTYNLFHHHGDAFLNLYSEVPQNLTVVHNPILYAGVTSLDVTANEDAFIALTVNGEIIATATATGVPLSITIPAQQPPDHILVTVTKQNYYRYTSLVEVIPPEGPYIVQNVVEIDDAAGNGNGIMETSESILASITVKNVGIEDATNVVVTIETADAYVTITDNTEPYGTVVAGATAVVTGGFAWDVANNIPDMHMVVFEMNATDGTGTWTTFFSVEGHGPVLELGSMTIDDSQGNNNGRLDPGETADVVIPTYNNGSYHALGAIGTLSCSSGFITLNSTTYDYNVIGAGLMEEAVFNVTVSVAAPVGTAVSFMYDVTSGGYNVQENFGATIGLIVEDWETGDMSQFDWTTGGNSNWAVSQQTPYEGTYCIKSGDINDNQSNWLSLEYEVFSSDSISFWFKVSSEASYDYLKFYIDNVELSSWSGEVGWERAAYAITSGTHTFKWTYSKDVSVSSGGDCAWLDFIILPAPPMTTAYAGQDGTICEGDTYACDGSASLYNVVNWTTSGNGTFDNSQTLTPVYTPGTLDISNGSVILTLTAYGPDNTVTDNMTLTIQSAPVSVAGEDALVCSDATYELINAVAENYESVAWTTSGDGTFDDANIINPVYTPGSGDIVTGSVTLMLSVTGNAPCGSAADDLLLTFEAAATAFAGENAATCSNLPLSLYSASAENYSSVEWTTSGDGTFDNVALLNPVYTPGLNDASLGTATLTLSVIGNDPCPAVTSEMIVTVLPVANAFAGEDHQINSDETYTLSDATAANYTSVSWTTSGDGTFNDASSVNPTYTPGTNDISFEQVTLTMTAANEDCGEFSDDMTLVVHTSGVNENLAGFKVSVSPNPNNGSFTIELNGDNNEVISIRIYNAQSELVYEAQNIKVDKAYNQTIQLNAEQGIYLIRIEGKDLLVNRKMIINK
jgi:hypothetical protein